MAFSVDHLSDYLSQRDFGPSVELTMLQTEESNRPSRLWKGDELPWNGLSCLSVVCYVLKFSSNSENNAVVGTIRRLNDLASEYYGKPQVVPDHTDTINRLNDLVSKYGNNNQPEDFEKHLVFHIGMAGTPSYAHLAPINPDNLDSDYERMLFRHVRERNLQNLGKRREIAQTFVNEFLPKVQKFFTVPKGNGHLTGFMHFLLQILNSESNHIRYEGIGCHVLQVINTFSDKWLRKKLNFILVVLGDNPFQFTDMEQVQNVLMEVEVVANDAGRFIYSFFFRTCPVNASQFLEEVLVLLQKVDLLNVKIEEHCVEFSKLSSTANANPMDTYAADSLFIVESLLKDIHENFMTKGVDDLTDVMKHQIATLHKELLHAQSFLKGINVPQEKDMEIMELKIRIRNTAYEAEYLLNSFVVEDVLASYLSVRLPMIIEKFQLTGKEFTETRPIPGMDVIRVKEDHFVEVPSQNNTVSAHGVVDDNATVGFEDVATEILDGLNGEPMNLEYICIYGMAGLGKTTLAKRLYNHPLTTERFHVRAWCVASQMYDRRHVLMEIFSSLGRILDKDKILKTEDASLISEMYYTLYQTLCGRRFLIVIDDVWDSGVWNDLGRFLPNNSNGSRILFTSRIKDAVPNPINGSFHKLPFLLNCECWKLLEKKVFLDTPCPPQLQDSGKRIAAKCNGLPLAVVVIAGILANIAKEKWAWEIVEESIVDTLTDNCMDVLELSYRYLPNHLKLCFLYLGVFAEDAKISTRKLIRLWIVEGFVPEDGDKSQEQVGEELLTDLIDRNLILVAEEYRSTGRVKACRIHDLLHEMCLRIAKQQNFLNLLTDYNSTEEKHQRLCVLFTAPTNLRPLSLHCRSFFGHLSDPSSCLPQMKRVRVMELTLRGDMSNINIFKRNILIHLRYLVIDQIIPESVLDNLVNLEVLCVNNMSIVNVSVIVLKMVKLRYLHARRAKFINDVHTSPPMNLQSLSNIYLWNTSDCRNLRSLPLLRKLKCWCPPLVPDLSFLTELESLEIKVSCLPNEMPGYDHINFPSNIKKLSLSYLSMSWEMMSVLGRLPELEALKLCLVVFEGKDWETNDDEFQKLRYLNLNSLELEQWITMIEHFKNLHHLVLYGCNKLQGIPTDLGHIVTLHTIEVHECNYETSMSAVQIEQEQRGNGNKTLKVIIYNLRWSKKQLVREYKEMNGEELSPRKEETYPVPTKFFCDYCGTYPIVGDRYRCKDCETKEIKYHLCRDCYSSGASKLPGRFNQEHPSEHKFELLDLVVQWT